MAVLALSFDGLLCKLYIKKAYAAVIFCGISLFYIVLFIRGIFNLQ